jgi:hypothetical protein
LIAFADIAQARPAYNPGIMAGAAPGDLDCG